jgi:hypothetical protein
MPDAKGMEVAMLTDDRKAIVDALAEVDLIYEVNRGRASRFQGELYEYAKTCLEVGRQTRQEEQAAKHLKVAEETKNATRWGTIFTAIAAVIAVVVALSQCSGVH